MKNLKRMLVWVFAIVCLAGLGLAGCGEKLPSEVMVYAYQYEGDENPQTGKVDAFHGLTLDEPADLPEGKEFYGWSTSKNWQEDSKDFVVKGNYISLLKVRKAAKNGEIKLFPAYKTQINYYFVLGIYTYRSSTGTATNDSGMTVENVANITTALKTYLAEEQHATDEQLALVNVREYSDKNVATYGAKVMKQGDVDVLFACGNTINTDGGVEIVKKSSGFQANQAPNKRRMVLLNHEDLSIAVYNWLHQYIHDTFDSTYVIPDDYEKVPCTITYALGENAHAEAEAPAAVETFVDAHISLPAAPAAADDYAFAGWRVGETLKQPGDRIQVTGNATITAEFNSGYTVTYSKGAATRTAATADPAAVSNLLEGAEIILPSAPETKAGFVFSGWQVGEDAVLKEAGATITVTEDVTVTAIYEVDKTVDLTIIIGYYANTNGGFVEENDPFIPSVKNAFETYLASVGILEGYSAIEYRAYTGTVAEAGGKITYDLTGHDQYPVDEENPEPDKESANVGIVIGFGKNLSSTGHQGEYKDRQDGFAMGTQTGRYVYRLTDVAISNIVYDWMVNDAAFATAVVTPIS